MAKTLTTDLRQIDVRQLAREGLLKPGTSFTWQWPDPYTGQQAASIRLEMADSAVIFRYRIGQGNDAHHVDQAVRLAHTPCNYGRSRPWFICPHCGRRVALVYIGELVACRRCYGMAYPVQKESRADRYVRHLDALRERLGWEPGFLNDNGWKPKGMHWRTYYRLAREHNHLKLEALASIMQRLG